MPTPASYPSTPARRGRSPGVKAVVTSADFAEQASEEMAGGEGAANIRDIAHNCLAHGKVLYDGHAVAAVAATSAAIADAALALVEVRYEVLPHVTDVEAAMAAEAPLLDETRFTSGLETKPDKPSNIASRMQLKRGDLD